MTMVSKEQQRLEKAKKHALQQGKFEEAAIICNELGGLKSSELKFEEALEEHKEELELSERLENSQSIAIAHRRIGETLVELGKYQDAIIHHKLYFKLATKCGHAIEVQRAWATIGRTYFNFFLAIEDDEIEESERENKDEVLKKAEKAYGKSLTCADNIKDSLSAKEYGEMKARLLLNLALTFDQRKNMSECSNCLRRAISLCKNNNLTEDLHRCQYSLASIYFSYGKLPASKSAVDQAINSAKSLKNKTYMTDALLLKAKLLICMKDYSSGKHYAKKAHKRTITAKKESTANFLKNIIVLNRIADKIASKNISTEEQLELYEKQADVLVAVGCYMPAIEKYKKALDLAIEMKEPQNKIAPIYFSLAQTSADAKDFTNAVQYWRMEIQCNVDNPKEICSTLLEVAKVQENQGLKTEVMHSYNEALEFAKKCRNVSQQYVILEKKLAFERRHGLLTAEETSKQLKSLKIESSDEESNDSIEGSDSNLVDEMFQSIDLKDLSDFTDSEEESTERCQPKRSGFQLRKNEKGETPLHRACISGNLKLVKKLVQQGHPINSRDHSGWLPIHEAANYGFLEIVEYLVENGAWINDPGGEYCGGVTPLHDAAVGGHLQLIRFLISKGASATARTNSGEIPLDCLRQWKMELESDLDSDIISDCIALEELLGLETNKDMVTNRPKQKKRVSENKVAIGWIVEDDNEKDAFNISADLNFALENGGTEMGLTNRIEEYDNPLLKKQEILNDWEDPKVVRTEYQAAIDNVRKLCPPAGCASSSTFEMDNDPFHIADDWLIDDLRVQKSGAKKRKRTLEDFNYSRTTKKATPKIRRSDSSSTLSHSDGNSRDEPFVVDKLIVNHANIELPHCLGVTVYICGESIAVPVTDTTLTFGWLAERTAQSYMETYGTKPKLTLLRQDGSVLSKQDLISSFPDKVINAQVDLWEESSLLERFTKSCDTLKVPLTKDIEGKVTFVENSGLLEVSLGSLLSKTHLKPLLNAIRFQSNLKSFSLSELQMTSDIINSLCKCLPTLAGLIQLNLRCCGLDTAKLFTITDAMLTSQSSLPKIQIQDVDLSCNFFSNDCANVLNTFLSCIPLLRSLNLSFCDLPPAVFKSQDLVSTIRSLRFLRVLNISGNALSTRGVKDYLQCISLSSLVCLDLSHTVTEPNLGKLLAEHLPNMGSSIRSLILRDCALSNSDIESLADALGNCLQLEEIDVSANSGLTWAGLSTIFRSVKVHDLPVLSFAFLGCNTNDIEEFDNSFEVIRIGQIKKVLLTDCFARSNSNLKLQEKWLLCGGLNASVLIDAFGTVTLSRDT